MSSARHILLVDDDEAIREIVRASLELVGAYQVTTASSGEQCLQVSRTSSPDAILLDVMMPGLDGPATFTRLREQPETEHVPVILLTAKTQEADRLRFAALGVDGVLIKPFDPLTLPGVVAGMLGWDTDE